MAFVPLLKDTTKNVQLETEGYAILPFLNNEEISILTDFFYSHHSSLPEGMYATSHAADFDFRKKMNDKIKRVCQRAVDVSFQRSIALGATFMVKNKGENGSLPPHQDWSIVDESRFFSYNIWLPLVDVNETNGTLLILPRSHKFVENIRGLNIPSSFERVVNEVGRYLLPVHMKAGEALVYDHRLLHASGINITDVPRLVVVYGLIPQNAEMRYYIGHEGRIEEYECSADFYFNEDITRGPVGLRLLRSFENNNPYISPEQLAAAYAPKKTFFQKLIDVFR